MKTLFAWGANSHAQLGVGFQSEMCDNPQKVDFTDSLIANGNVSIKCISGGGGHVFILDNNGRLFGCGWNNQGQLGIETTNDVTRFKRIPLECFDGKTIENIACGWDCSAAICTDGSVYIWGSNVHNQLGVSKKEIPFSSKPLHIKMPQNEKVKCVAFNLQNTSIWTTCGVIYLFGKLKHYKGLQTIEQHQIVNHNGIDYLRLNFMDVAGMSAGQNHILMLNKEENYIFGIGNNKYSQCERIHIDEQVDQICSGWTHNAAVTVNGNVWLWGRNNYGQCGISLEEDPSHQTISLPRKLQIKEKIQHVHLGAEHCVALTQSGKLFTWGWNEHGNCGNSSIENVFSPVAVNLPGKCLITGSGAGFCYALVDEK